jgi:BirA family transcriptional regulator, biotin operon repressor / biotin---[acetyl-CoA-carboxylase] ligase
MNIMIDVVRILRETTIARAEHRPTLTSTNDRAAECAAQGVKDLPLVVVTDEQTAGRGRGSKRWWTGRGALAFSLLVDAETVAADADRSPLVSLAAAVAVVDTIAPLLPGRQVGIHWPNDVFVEDRKLAGILVEVLPDRRHVIGIGLNTNNTAADAPAELQPMVATLRDLTGRQHDQTTLLIGLLRRLEQEFSRLRGDAKSVALRANELCLDRGRRLTLHWADRAVAGPCRGIAADGALLLETPSGLESFYSGTTLSE